MNDNPNPDVLGPFDSKYVRTMLEIAADLKAEFDAQDDSAEKSRSARWLVRTLLEVAQGMIGREVMSLAVSLPSEDAPRLDHLHALISRLHLAAPIFDSVDSPNDKHSLWAAQSELGYIVRGDTPRLFSRTMKGGRNSTNKTKLAEHWLLASCWVEYLDGVLGTKNAAKDAVAPAFGVTRDALDKWKGQARKHLGSDYVDRELGRAKAGKSPHFYRLTDDNVRVRLRADGDAYMIEEGFSADSVENRVVHFPSK